PSTGDSARFIVARDPRGYAAVAKDDTGRIPAPFVDVDKDSLPDVDILGRFITNDRSIPPSPFASLGTVPPTRDHKHRLAPDAHVALATSAPGKDVSSSVPARRTPPAPLLAHLKPLVNAAPSPNHETLLYAVAGAPVLFGERDGSPKTQRQYSPDPALVTAWK